MAHSRASSPTRFFSTLGLPKNGAGVGLQNYLLHLALPPSVTTLVAGRLVAGRLVAGRQTPPLTS